MGTGRGGNTGNDGGQLTRTRLAQRLDLSLDGQITERTTERTASAVPVNAQAQQNMGEIHEEGTETAMTMLSGIPAQQTEAVSPPVGLVQPIEDTASETVSKKERKLLEAQEQEAAQREAEAVRQREEQERLAHEAELEARHREYEQERARLRAEGQRIVEENRQRRRMALFRDSEVVASIGRFAQENNASLKLELAKNFLRIAATKLMEIDPDLRGDHEGTSHYEPMNKAYKIMIMENAATDSEAEQLLNEMERFESNFEMLELNGTMESMISRDLLEIFQEEIKVNPIIAEAAEGISIEQDERATELRDSFGAFEQRMSEQLGVDSNMLNHHGQFEYLVQDQAQQEYRSQVDAVIQANPSMARIEAERQVLHSRRTQIKERAIDESMAHGVVSDVSKDDWKQYGGASYKQTVPVGQAKKIVASCHGFVGMKEIGNGMATLYQSLPEYFAVNGKQIHFRRGHNIMMKLIADVMVDEQGKLRDTAQSDILSLLDVFRAGDIVYTTNDPEQIELQKKEFIENKVSEFEIYAKRVFGEEAAGEMLQDLSDYLEVTMGVSDSFFTGFAVMNSEAIETLNRFPETMGAARIPLTERLAQERARMQGENVPEEEITKRLDIITHFYSDMDFALAELKSIKDMNVDDTHTPMINACSANGDGIHSLMERLGHVTPQNKMDKLQYATIYHVEAEPLLHAQYLVDHTPASMTKQAALELRDKVRTCVESGRPVEKKDMDKLISGTFSARKYEYHVAGNVGTLEDEDIAVTVEEFAAETTTFVVSPISGRSAIGLYRSGEAGMKGYYNHDNPLPDVMSVEAAAMKQTMN